MSSGNGRIALAVPLDEQAVGRLRSGDRVAITGTLVTARDAAHRRFVEIIEGGGRLPFKPRGAVIYYVGPTPAPPGRVIGSAGPTTAARMDPYAGKLLELGVKGMIGKGPRSAGLRESLKQHRAVYFVATGGAGALLSGHVRKADVIAFEELGPEAVRLMEVEDFPAIVAYDSLGGDLFETAQAKYRG